MREMGLDDFAFSHIFGVPNGDLEVTWYKIKTNTGGVAKEKLKRNGFDGFGL
jgi:hypothetical protein